MAERDPGGLRGDQLRVAGVEFPGAEAERRRYHKISKNVLQADAMKPILCALALAVVLVCGKRR